MGFLIYILILVFPITATATEFIPDRAYKYMPTVIEEQERILPNHPLPPYFLSLIEHESCVSLKSSRCWSPKSELKTSREQGVGLGQLTRAWRKNGSLRFDRVTELAIKYPNHVGMLSWKTIKQRPDLQIRGLLLVYRENYARIPNTVTSNIERLAIADMAYNGGFNRFLKDRRRCGLSKGCNPDIYFGNIEKYCTASKKILYGNRSACDINRHHVKDTLTKRIFKYGKWYINQSKIKNKQ